MYCKKCGAENNDNATFCIKCGEKISPDISNDNTPNQDNNTNGNNSNEKSKSKKIVLIIVAVIIGIVILIFAINGIRDAILAKQVSDDFAALEDIAEENLGDVDTDFDDNSTEEGATFNHDTSLDEQPHPGVTGGAVSAENEFGSYMNTNDWIANFSVYSYNTGVFNITDENTVKTVVSDFGLSLDEGSKTQYNSIASYSDSLDLTLVDNESYAETAIDKLEISADYERKVSDLSNGQKAGSDFIINEISARNYYTEGPDNDFMIANLRIGQSVSGKTFDEFGTPTGIILKGSDSDTYYEYAQDAFDNSVDGDTIIVYYLSEPGKVTDWGMEDFYMASFQISASTGKITSMKLAYEENCGFGMLIL